MYAKVVITLCALGVAHAGHLNAIPHAYSEVALAAPALTGGAYAVGPSKLYSAYSISTAHGSPVASYAAAAPAYASAHGYAAVPALTVSQTITPAKSSYSSYSTQINHGSPSYSAPVYTAPAISTYSVPAISTYSAPTISTYSAPTISSYTTPAIASYAAPTFSTYASPLISSYAPSYSSYVDPSYSSYGSPAYSYASPAIKSVYSAPILSGATYDAHATW